jgi:hypothetical protein
LQSIIKGIQPVKKCHILIIHVESENAFIQQVNFESPVEKIKEPLLYPESGTFSRSAERPSNSGGEPGNALNIPY